MTNKNEISSIYISHGQSFLNPELDISSILSDLKKFDIKLLNKIFYDEEEIDIADKIISSLNKENSLNFPISNHEKFRLLKLKNINMIIKYIVFRCKFYLSSHKKKLFNAPPYVLMELVSACNLRCPMCFQSDKSFTKKPYMGVMKEDLAYKILDEADNLNVGAITFASRGEPMMHKKFSEIISYASLKKNIFEIKVNTNGTYLNEKNSKSIFENDISVVVISADHFEKKEYEKYRLGANFEEVVSNVKNFYEMRKKYPDCSTEIRISGVDVSKKIDKDKFEKFWIKFSDSVSIGDPIERWDTYNNSKKNIKSPCPKFWDRMYIWHDGKINPCDEDYKSFLSYGNVNQESIKKIWNGRQVNLYRKKHLNLDRMSLNPCDRCGVDAKH